MQMGMIRPERMGGNMGRRGMQAGRDCVIFDLDANFVRALQMEAAVGRCLVHGRLVSEARSTTLCLVDGARRDCRSSLDRQSGLSVGSVQMPCWSIEGYSLFIYV